MSLVLSILLNGPKNHKSDITIPYLYRIVHKDINYRELAIVHPRNQLRVMDYIDKYKHLIMYFCSLSPFSIRYPSKVSTNAEVFPCERQVKRWRKLFLSGITSLYSRYKNLHEFYESKDIVEEIRNKVWLSIQVQYFQVFWWHLTHQCFMGYLQQRGS